MISEPTSARTAAHARRAALALLSVVVTGCMVGPDYHLPALSVPVRWSEAPTQSAPAAGSSRWWTVFDDPELSSLIERATAANLDIKLAEARVREARANRKIAAAPLWPSVDASASYDRSLESEHGLAMSGGSHGGAPGQTNLYQAGFDASWEIDVFGGVRRSVEAAQADLEAAQYDQAGVVLTLLGEVARNYIELRGFQKQLDVARSNLAAQQETLDLTRARYQGGLATDLDVARAEAQVKTTESQIPALEISSKEATHRLSVLIAEPPGALTDELAQSRPIPAGPSELPPGLPSDLLRQRPDVRRAERQLAAATARVGVATADLFPKFSLTGTAGLESVSASDFFTAGSKLWSIGPTVTWPIFRGGQILATIEARNAEEEQALIGYRQAVLGALEEVENSIVAYMRERDRRNQLTVAVASNQRAVHLASELYTRGLSDFLTVLDAQRSLFQTESDLAESDAAVSTNLVALQKALGGGWDTVSVGG